jgi:UDP-glucose 4-epimerase
MFVLITGATGTVGPLVVDAVLAAGYCLRTLSLDYPTAVAWPTKVETRLGDVTDHAEVKAAMRGVDVVIHLAALLHIVNPPLALKERYKLINVRGTATVVEAAIQAGVKRIIYFSTIAVYGPSQGRVLVEQSPPNPDTFYAQTKLEAERFVLEAKGNDSRSIGTVLRFGAIYGSRSKGNYQRLVQSLARGRFVPIGKGNNQRTLIYDKDVARATLLALEHPDAAGKIFNVSDGQLYTVRDIISAICQALGRRPPGLSLPIQPVRFAAGLLEDGAKLFGRKSPIDRATIDKYTEDMAVDSSRIQKELGFKPQYDLLKGWQETVQEMRRRGEL